MPEGQRIINVRETVGSLDSVTKVEQIEQKGKVDQIILHFPGGCNSLIAVRVYVGSEAILPIEGYVSLDDSTPSFNLYRPINPYDSIRVEVVNHDDTYDHTISVIINVKLKEIKAY